MAKEKMSLRDQQKIKRFAQLAKCSEEYRKSAIVAILKNIASNDTSVEDAQHAEILLKKEFVTPGLATSYRCLCQAIQNNPKVFGKLGKKAEKFIKNL